MNCNGDSSMIGLSVKDAYDMYQKHSESTHKLWAYFSAVSLAILAYTIGTDKNDWSSLTFIIIGLSYFLFAVANRLILVESQKEVERFALLFNSLACLSSLKGDPKLAINVTAINHKQVDLFHWGATLIIILAIILSWYQKTDGC